MNVGVAPSRSAKDLRGRGRWHHEPWGMDWDEQWQLHQHRDRPPLAGDPWRALSPYVRPNKSAVVYELIEQHADHVHWAENRSAGRTCKGVTARPDPPQRPCAHGPVDSPGGQCPPSGRESCHDHLHTVGAPTWAVCAAGQRGIIRCARGGLRFNFRPVVPRHRSLIRGARMAMWSSATGATPADASDNDGIPPHERAASSSSATAHRLRRLANPRHVALHRGASSRSSASPNGWLQRTAARLAVDRWLRGGGRPAPRRREPRCSRRPPIRDTALRALWRRIMPIAICRKTSALLAGHRGPRAPLGRARLLVDRDRGRRRSPRPRRWKSFPRARREHRANRRGAGSGARVRVATPAARQAAARRRPAARRAEVARRPLASRSVLWWAGIAPPADAPGGVPRRIPCAARAASPSHRRAPRRDDPRRK